MGSRDSEISEGATGSSCGGTYDGSDGNVALDPPPCPRHLGGKREREDAGERRTKERELTIFPRLTGECIKLRVKIP